MKYFYSNFFLFFFLIRRRSYLIPGFFFPLEEYNIRAEFYCHHKVARYDNTLKIEKCAHIYQFIWLPKSVLCISYISCRLKINFRITKRHRKDFFRTKVTIIIKKHELLLDFFALFFFVQLLKNYALELFYHNPLHLRHMRFCDCHKDICKISIYCQHKTFKQTPVSMQMR